MNSLQSTKQTWAKGWKRVSEDLQADLPLNKCSVWQGGYQEGWHTTTCIFSDIDVASFFTKHVSSHWALSEASKDSSWDKTVQISCFWQGESKSNAQLLSPINTKATLKRGINGQETLKSKMINLERKSPWLSKRWKYWSCFCAWYFVFYFGFLGFFCITRHGMEELKST